MYKQAIILLRYNKDIVCVIEKGNSLCRTFIIKNRRNLGKSNTLSHEPYIPNIKDAVFYNCSSTQCEVVKIYSITQVATPNKGLKICYQEFPEKYKCSPLNYYHYKDIDKLLFLSNNIPNKEFYLIDCLAYSDGGRVCHKKSEVDSYTKLVDTGNIARPNETNILSQEEFICEQSADAVVNCDLNLYVPYIDGLKLKQSYKIDKKILLKTGRSVMILKYACKGSWCGYTGNIVINRNGRRYDSVGKVYRCYYARKQQICKKLYGSHKNTYNARDWLST